MARRPWTVLLRRPWGESWSLVLNSGAVASPGTGGFGSFYYPVAPASFDRVDIDPAVRLLRGPWTSAFLSYATSLVRPGGKVSIPVYGRGADAKGQLSRESVEMHLGHKAEVEAVSVVGGVEARVVAKFDDPLPGPHSTLGWYLSNARDVLLASDAGPSGPAIELMPPRLVPGGSLTGVNSAVESLVAQQAYYVGGIAYKGPLLAHIVRTFIPDGVGLALTDIGGGYGLLAAELLVDRDSAVTSVAVVDQSDANRALAQLLQSWLRDCSHDAFTFINSDVEAEFELPEADVVVAIGSLLYVPRESLGGVLDRMWEAVRPGGVLVVHENIKHPSYVRDFDVMFEPHELDGFLKRFGTVRYFASSATVEMQHDRVGRATVFRVVAKSR